MPFLDTKIKNSEEDPEKETLKAFSMDEAAKIIEKARLVDNIMTYFAFLFFYLAIHPFSVCYLLNTITFLLARATTISIKMIGLTAILKEAWNTAQNTEEEYSYLIVQSLLHK